MESFYQKGGFTLIELMFAIAILGIVFTVIINLYIGCLHVFRFNQDQLSLKQEVRNLMLKIGKDIRMANTVIIGDSNKSIIIDGNITYKIQGNNQLIRVKNAHKQVITNHLDNSQIHDISDIFKLNSDFVDLDIILSKDKTSHQIKDKIYFRRGE